MYCITGITQCVKRGENGLSNWENHFPVTNLSAIQTANTIINHDRDHSIKKKKITNTVSFLNDLVFQI